MPSAENLVREAERQLVICNACRYCEGYCPVFPAVEARREFTRGDVFYLANLCHDCRACYYACMYAPPHPFGVNLPQVLSEARLESYQAWCWPKGLNQAFSNWRVGLALAAATCTLVLGSMFVLVPAAQVTARHVGPGAFYAVIPFLTLLAATLMVSAYALVVCLLGAARFWIETGSEFKNRSLAGAWRHTMADILQFRWLRGGGPGCYYPKQTPSAARRVYHALVFYGFLTALLSTTVAAIYQHGLDELPPYALTSAPVLLGTIGGLAMIIGVSGLIAIKIRSDREPADTQAFGMDYLFLILLGLCSLSGVLTLVFRATTAMGWLLAIHLALTAALFVSVPYGKFVHAIYRSLAILRYRLEQSGRY